MHTHTRLTALFLGLHGWAGTRKVKPIWILLKQETVSGSGISWAHMQVCTSLQTDNHASTPPLSFLQAGCRSGCPTNSVKALKTSKIVLMSNKNHGMVNGLIYKLTHAHADSVHTASMCVLLCMWECWVQASHIVPLSEVWSNMARHCWTNVDVSVILWNHVHVMKHVAVEVRLCRCLTESSIHQRRLVEHIWRLLYVN